MKFFYKLYNNIKNLIIWSPVIWNDRQWDDYYLFKMISYKLALMEEYFNSDKPCVLRADRVADQIHKTNLVIKRILADNYLENAMLPHDKKWGHAIFFEKEILGGNYELEIKRKGVVTKREEEQERKEFLKRMKHSQYMQQQDITYVFKLISKYILNWWD